MHIWAYRANICCSNQQWLHVQHKSIWKILTGQTIHCNCSLETSCTVNIITSVFSTISINNQDNERKEPFSLESLKPQLKSKDNSGILMKKQDKSYFPYLSRNGWQSTRAKWKKKKKEKWCQNIYFSQCGHSKEIQTTLLRNKVLYSLKASVEISYLWEHFSLQNIRSFISGSRMQRNLGLSVLLIVTG